MSSLKLKPDQIFSLLTELPGSAEGRDLALDGISLLSDTEKRFLNMRLVDSATPDSADAASFQDPVLRGYLLTALGRVGLQDEASLELLKLHAGKAEKNAQVRFWALGALYHADREAAFAFGKQELAGAQEEKLILLGAALKVLENKDEAALGTLRKPLLEFSGNDEKSGHGGTGDVLRIMGAIGMPLLELVDPLVHLLRHQPNDARLCFLIARAFGEFPEAASVEKRTASDALIYFLENSGNKRELTGAREAALKSLGRLGSPKAEPIFLQEIKGRNLNLIRAAAAALTELLGVEQAVRRILEAAAADTNPSTQNGYAIALRWMSSDTATVAETLDRISMESNFAQTEMVRRIMAEMGGVAVINTLAARKSMVNDYKEKLLEEGDKFQEIFDQNMEAARKGFRVAMAMDIILFGVGLLLLGIGVFFAIRAGQEALSWYAAAGSGAAGLISILISNFISKPREKVFRSTNIIVNFQVILQGYLRQLHQADQSFTRLMLEEDKVSPAIIREYSEMIRGTMNQAIGDMLRLKNQEMKEQQAEFDLHRPGGEEKAPGPKAEPKPKAPGNPAESSTAPANGLPGDAPSEEEFLPEGPG